MAVLSGIHVGWTAVLRSCLCSEKRQGGVYAMRILWVWVVAIILMSSVSFGWYVSLPVVFGISEGLAGVGLSGTAQGIVTVIQYVTIWWGPIMILFILLWALISSQRVDPTSERYG